MSASEHWSKIGLVFMGEASTSSERLDLLEFLRGQGLEVAQMFFPPEWSMYLIQVNCPFGEEPLKRILERSRALPGVVKAVAPSDPNYVLAGRELFPERRTVLIKDRRIGGTGKVVWNRLVRGAPEGLDRMVKELKRRGVSGALVHSFLAGPVPGRLDPLDDDVEKLIAVLKEIANVGLVSIMDVFSYRTLRLAEAMADLIDWDPTVAWALFDDLVATARPVMIRRPATTSNSEFLGLAEFFLLKGKWEILLCDGGFRRAPGGGPKSVPLDTRELRQLRELTCLPIIADLSAQPNMVERMSEVISAGADGSIQTMGLGLS